VNRNASVADLSIGLPDAVLDTDERRVIDISCEAEIAGSSPAQVTAKSISKPASNHIDVAL
jgi:hypothetical protein